LSEEHYAYLLSEDEKWWNRRRVRNQASDSTHAFVRRGQVGPKGASKILFYVKHPVKAIEGHGDFLERITGNSDDLWNLYGAETVFKSKDEYDSFVEGRKKVTFIRFKDMEEFEDPVAFEVVHAATGLRQMPRGGKYLSRETVNSILGKEM